MLNILTRIITYEKIVSVLIVTKCHNSSVCFVYVSFVHGFDIMIAKQGMKHCFDKDSINGLSSC